MNDPELKAMGAIAQALADLSEEQRRNVLLYINVRYGEQTAPRNPAGSGPTTESKVGQYESLGDFFDAVNPHTEADRVLAVSYWLQVVEGATDFESFPVNKELKNLGHPVSNITRAIETLVAQTPRLVIQIAKTGNAKQARKTYKVTREGIKRVQSMLGQGDGVQNGG
jgi:hypothetical protein